MRTTHRCPKCQGQKLYVCENRQPHTPPASSKSYITFRITTALHDTHIPVGTYETWSCAACGYTEWYAQDKEGVLERLSRVADSGVRVVEAGAGSPFR